MTIAFLVLALGPGVRASEPVVGSSPVQTTPAVAARPTALFIGDTYTSSGGDAGVQPFPCRVADSRRWNCVVSGLPGTGYVIGGAETRFALLGAPGDVSKTVSERIPFLHSRYNANIVVLDAGRSDAGGAPADVRSAVLASVADTHASWPDAEIVLIRPWILKRPSDEIGFDTGFWNEIVQASTAGGAPVRLIDPQGSGWLAGRDASTLLSSDGEHPNDLGVAAIASELDRSMTGLGIPQ
ncbi:SGNH/GDSL hydrolase family protein [Actinomycetes bacterium M1A6_2h]